jgi:hypothetical protein
MKLAGVITFQVCEQVATMMALSYWILRSPGGMGGLKKNLDKFTGMAEAIVGMTWYTLFEMRNRDLQIQAAARWTEGELDDDESYPVLIEPPDVVTEMADGRE